MHETYKHFENITKMQNISLPKELMFGAGIAVNYGGREGHPEPGPE